MATLLCTPWVALLALVVLVLFLVFLAWLASRGVQV